VIESTALPSDVLLNGEPADTLSVADRGLHYGDGLFETISCVDGQPLWLDRHLQRLMMGCQRLGIGCPDTTTVRTEITSLAAQTDRSILKLIVTRGGAVERGYRPTGREQTTRILMRYPWPPEARHEFQMGFSAVRLGENRELAGIKHLNRLEQVLARQQLTNTPIDEVVMLSSSGLAICGSMSNLFVCEDGALLTPELTLCGVAGVMRGLVMEAAQALGLELQVVAVQADRLRQASSLFVTNVRLGLQVVHRLEGRRLPVDARVSALQDWISAQQI
jgi:4-amino-4-deoxychorismate lyase